MLVLYHTRIEIRKKKLGPVYKKDIQFSFKNKYVETTTVKYGWTMFCICTKYYRGFVPMVNRHNPETKRDNTSFM